jgi:hypothetical protein
MNVIEGAWISIKIAIIKNWGAPYIFEWIDRAWKDQWNLFSQDKIRALIIRMAAINTLIIECEGRNDFHK